MSEQIAAAKLTNQVDRQGKVLAKLVAFSLALGIAPLSSYFASEKYLWNGNSTYAAITAIVAANVVLVAYIITSVLEEKQALAESSAKQPENESKKTR